MKGGISNSRFSRPGWKYFLLFLNGFLLASLLYFNMEDNYEQQIFSVLASHVKEATGKVKNAPDSTLVQAMHLTHYLGERRSQIFKYDNFSNLKSKFHPVTFDLVATKGACGSYSYILSRLLQELNIENRIAQMKVAGLYGGHILVEAKTANGWVVLDPSYDLSFQKPGGGLASFADVQANWENYKQQVPGNYDHQYRYEGVRYTNWSKIPVVMPALKGILKIVIGEKKLHTFSLRTFVLRKYHLLMMITFFLLIASLMVTIRKQIQYGMSLAALYITSVYYGKSSRKTLQLTAG